MTSSSRSQKRPGRGNPSPYFFEEVPSAPAPPRNARPGEWGNVGKIETEIGKHCLLETRGDAICPSSDLDCQAQRQLQYGISGSLRARQIFESRSAGTALAKGNGAGYVPFVRKTSNRPRKKSKHHARPDRKFGSKLRGSRSRVGLRAAVPLSVSILNLDSL